VTSGEIQGVAKAVEMLLSRNWTRGAHETTTPGRLLYRHAPSPFIARFSIPSTLPPETVRQHAFQV